MLKTLGVETMKLYSGTTYWDKRESSYESHPPLRENITTEVLIVGAGMSGNLAAYELAKRGHQVVVIEQHKVGGGSSTANTGMLQYSSDMMLTEFIESIGEKKAVLFYQMCLDAMKDLTKLNESLDHDGDYILRDSIYYASEEDDVKNLEKEFQALQKHSFPVEYLDQSRLKKEYGINKGAALKTWFDAEVNPYKFIQAIVQKNKTLGVKYYEDTEIELEQIQSDSVTTKSGHKIHFNQIILATGYTKIYPCIKDMAQIERTYAFSAITPADKPWQDHAMIWETKRPYLYFRTAKDHHIIAGGEDEDISSVVEDEGIIFEKTERIRKKIEEIFPHLRLDVTHRWNALFGTSKDGLPFIGEDPNHKNRFYLLGYEGNGTCYSMAGANILADLIEGKSNKYADVVKLDR